MFIFSKLIDQLLEQISENEKKLDGSKKAIKITLDANQRCLKTNSVLMRELEEVKMLNSYSFSKSCIDLNRPENYRHSVQATAPTWDDLN